VKNLVPAHFGLGEGKHSPERLRARIEQLEKIMFESPARIEIPRRDYFAAGLYAREILIPKGTVLTGKIHCYEHLNFIAFGDISVLTENGIERIVGPATIISQPGTKRVGYAHEDTLWTTVHAAKWSDRDGDQMEKALVVETHEQYKQFLLAQEEQKCLT